MRDSDVEGRGLLHRFVGNASSDSFGRDRLASEGLREGSDFGRLCLLHYARADGRNMALLIPFKVECVPWEDLIPFEDWRPSGDCSRDGMNNRIDRKSDNVRDSNNLSLVRRSDGEISGLDHGPFGDPFRATSCGSSLRFRQSLFDSGFDGDGFKFEIHAPGSRIPIEPEVISAIVDFAVEEPLQ